MTLASDDPAVASLSVLDDWDETDRAKVNIIAGQAGVAGGAGAVSALTQRVINATDDPGVVALQVIDDWDESDRAKVNLIVGQAGVAAGSGSAGATVIRTVSATDDPVVSKFDGTNHVGKVGETISFVPFTLSLNTSIMATGEVLAETQAIDAAFRVTGGTGTIIGISVLDEDDQGQSFTFYFHNANVSMGTENSNPSITDANARTLISRARILTSDYDDLGGSKYAYIECMCPVKAISGTDDLAVSAVLNSGTPTYTASGITAVILMTSKSF
jgi:hypothetical protein